MRQLKRVFLSDLAEYRRAVRWRYWLLLWLALAMAPAVNATEDAPARAAMPNAATARFLPVDSALGLSQDSVLSMVQDPQGFVWLGTQDGLNRFDGYEFRQFRGEGTGGSAQGALASNWIQALSIGPDARLWVGTADGLHRYVADREGFERYAHAPEQPRSLAGNAIYVLHHDAAGRLWVGSGGGLSRFEAETADFRNYTQHTDPALPDLQVRALASAPDGRLWIGTVAGLAVYDPERDAIVSPPVPSPLAQEPINALHWDRDGRLWVGADRSGLLSFDPQAGTWQRLATDGASTGTQHSRIHALLSDSSGVLWVGTESGLDALQGHGEAWQVEHFQHRPHQRGGLGRGRVASLMRDRDGSLWVGTWDSGASRLHPSYSRFLSFDPGHPTTQTLLRPQVHALWAEAQRLWLGTAAGLYEFDAGALSTRRIPGTEALDIYAIAATASTMWLATGTGLARFDRESGRIDMAAVPESLRGMRLRRLQLHGDQLWLWAELRGLYVFRGADLKLLAQHSFATNVVNIAPLDAQTMLVAAGDGLHYFDIDGSRRRTWVPVGADPVHGLPARPAGFERAADGTVYVATYGAGVMRMQADARQATGWRFEPLTRGLGLANEGINAIAADADGRLWLATDRGISSFDPARRRIENFDALDGALARGYYFSARAVLADGRIAFGSKDGLTLFDPRLQHPRHPPRAPLLLGLEREGKALAPHAVDPASPLTGPVSTLRSLELPPGGGRSIGLNFGSLDFIAPHRLHYQYRLIGLDQDWIRVDAGRRYAQYTNLDPGSYRFELQAVSVDGLHSPLSHWTIGVAPHWWQSLPARIGLLLLIVALATAAHKARTRHLKREQQRLEALVHSRTEALAEAKHRAEQALEGLKAAQHELVRAEKLAALGGLVAGVAHEVNTPLGVALTASSHLYDSASRVQQKLEMASLKRSEIAEYLRQATVAAELISRNLDRAANLVMTFKQVAVDRSADGRRDFDLHSTLHGVMQSLKPVLTQHRIDIELSCPPDLTMNSFPGALGQVLTNLVQNVIVHAYSEVTAEDSAAGQATRTVQVLAAASATDRVQIRCIDQGRGMDAADHARAFEPFFTTRRNQGSIGLGLHIAHNVVTQKLGGQIELHAVLGSGTTVTIELPHRAP